MKFGFVLKPVPRKILQSALGLWLFLLSQTWAQELPPWARAYYAYPRHQRLNIDGALLGRCMALVTTADQSSPSFLPYSTADCALNHENFMVYLEANQYRPCDFATGLEPQLRRWVLSQTDNSINPVGLYRQALRLSQGNVWSASLTIFQLLRNEARWWNSVNYHYASTNEDEILFFNKLIDLRGDLRERGVGFTGDHPGTWFRIWGIMLYRIWITGGFRINQEMQERQQATVGTSFSFTRELAHFVNGARTQMMAHVAEWAKIFHTDGEDDFRKAEINAAAAEAIGAMIESIGGRNDGLSFEGCLTPLYLFSRESSH